MIAHLNWPDDEAIFDLSDERENEILRETIDSLIKKGIDFRFNIVTRNLT